MPGADNLSRKPRPAWAVAAFAATLGAALGWGALDAAGRAAPGTSLPVAASQALRAHRLGQASIMRAAFESEIQRSLSGGSFLARADLVGLKLTYAAPGRSNSLSRWRPQASPPCRLELSIDGEGSPSLEAAFAGFSGRLDGAAPAMGAPRQLASAFTVAHEMGHCALHAQGESAPAKALDAELDALAPARSEGERARVRSMLKTPFGLALFHEGFADVEALAALARRMDDASFARAASKLLAKRETTAAALAAEGQLTPYQTAWALRQALPLGRARLASMDARRVNAWALRCAAQGALAFLGADPERAQRLGLSAGDAEAAAGLRERLRREKNNGNLPENKA